MIFVDIARLPKTLINLAEVAWDKVKHLVILIPMVMVLVYTHKTYEYVITRTAPIELLASAIATKEGYFDSQTNIPHKDNNPGDLTASGLNRPKDKHGFVIFKSRQEGIAALYSQLMVYAVRGYTIKEMIMKYAPPADGNNDDQYVQDITNWTGMDPNRKMMDYLTIVNLRIEAPAPSDQHLTP